ncbi:hypothetical protein [Burkholderia ambifaria]|uniref:hypothetical protein n=1 Tax=Burkholderia ambifaria TaxID=152480 RepID=UPI000F80C3AF|nr:hypothetical protein [Burkholderia ambifaria]
MIKAITYTNTKTTLPGWIDPLHEKERRGYSFENAGFYFHIYGKDYNLFHISEGLTASEAIGKESLTDWAVRVFGAVEIVEAMCGVGEVIKGVWRPGIYYQDQIYQALAITEDEQRTAEQALRILIEKLDEILLYIEPSATGLKSYGHKTRELLMLTCTEVENSWTQYMKLGSVSPAKKSFTTNDYVKLAAPLHLVDYEITFTPFQGIVPIRPFLGWTSSSPTKSLSWYDAYNLTKHDRSSNFSQASLENCLWALSAAIAMFCARYSPFPLLEGQSTLSALFRQHFSIGLRDPDPRSFYIPLIEPSDNFRKELMSFSARQLMGKWSQLPLVI